MRRTIQVCRFFSVVQVAICQVPASIRHLVSAHGAKGERPWGDGRAPMGRWALTFSERKTGIGGTVTTQVVWCPQKWIGWVIIMGGMMPSVCTNLAHKRYDYPAISWLQNLNLSFPQRRFLFFPRTFPATRARGSHDPRPQVTRPAGAGHATRGRGSLAMRRSETEISLGKPASPRGRTYHWLALDAKPDRVML